MSTDLDFPLAAGLAREEYETIRASDTEALRAQLAGSLARTAQEMLRMAAIVRTLEERGVDLRDLRVGMLDYLRRVAYGQVLPEVVVRFAEHPLLIRRIAALALPDQRRLVEGQGVPVAVRREDGTIDHRLADPLFLSGPQINQVFARDRLRSIAEQTLVLEDPQRRPRQPVHRGRCRADRERGGLIVRRTLVPLADVLAALADLRGGAESDLNEALESSLVVRLSAREHQNLKTLAAQSDCTATHLIRRALAAAGLLGIADKKE